LGEGRGNTFIVFLKRGRQEIAVEAGNSRKDPGTSEETIPEGQAGANCESHWKKMIGKPYSGKPNVRFDEGELEIEPSATTPALYSTEVLTLTFHSLPLLPAIGDLKKFLTTLNYCDSKVTMKKEPIDIKTIRVQLGFTQEDLARKLGLALSTVSKWEQGVSSPSRLAREKLEKLLKKEGMKKK
jgi:putative transcriptional regulator